MRRAAALLLVIVALAGCRRQDDGAVKVEDLETVEVGAALDVDLTTEEDVEGRQQGPSIGGAVPADFPSDFPLYVPSSLVDYVSEPEGPRYLVFHAPAGEQEVRECLAARLRDSDWRREGSAADGAATYRKNGRTVRLQITSMISGSEIRLDY